MKYIFIFICILIFFEMLYFVFFVLDCTTIYDALGKSFSKKDYDEKCKIALQKLSISIMYKLFKSILGNKQAICITSDSDTPMTISYNFSKDTIVYTYSVFRIEINEIGDIDHYIFSDTYLSIAREIKYIILHDDNLKTPNNIYGLGLLQQYLKAYANICKGV